MKEKQKMPQYIPPKEGRKNFIRLDFNEHGRGPSSGVLEALRTLNNETFSMYPEYAPLLDTLSEKLNVEKDEIFISNGSGEAIKFIIEEYLNPEEEVVLLEPTFSLFEILCQKASAKITSIPYEPKDFSFPKEKVMQSIGKDTRMFIIANPNNPTGTLTNYSDLEEIIKTNPNTLIVIDEAYALFSGINNHGYEKIRKYPNVFILRTFSKAYGLAALRLGYVVSHRKNIARLRSRSLPFNVNQIAVIAAQAALQDQKYLDEYLAEVIESRNLLQKSIQELGFLTYPSAANFLLVNFGNQSTLIRDELYKAGILVRDFTHKKSTKNCLRISIGTLEQTKTLIQQIRIICKKPDCLLFDMDGVLVDESESYRACIIKVVEYFSRQTINLSLLEKYKNKGGYNNDYDCALAILKDMNIEINREVLIERFQKYFLDDLFHKERWIMPVPLLLDFKKYYSLGIVTGRPRKEAEATLKKFGAQGFFDALITADDVEKGKPSPEGLIKAKTLLKAQKALYVGDLIDDACAAEAANMPFIAVVPPKANIHDSIRTFKENGFQTILKDISQIGLTLLPEKKLKRQSLIQRKTEETDIRLLLNIDGKGTFKGNTGISFFDHMMATFAKHGLFDIDIQCKGDLQVDQHHSIEDLGISLGEAFSQALGNKRGIKRSGYFVFPMDESLSTCAVDIINRPHLQYKCAINERKIGDFETINLRNFFSGFVNGSRTTLHIQVSGEDPHHKIESLFKAFGKSMKMACLIDEENNNNIPSAKGKI